MALDKANCLRSRQVVEGNAIRYDFVYWIRNVHLKNEWQNVVVVAMVQTIRFKNRMNRGRQLISRSRDKQKQKCSSVLKWALAVARSQHTYRT